MKHMKRRSFLKGMGALGGTALGLGALDPFELQARQSVLRYGLNSRDARRLDPMLGPNSSDKTVLQTIFNGLVRTKPGVVGSRATRA